MKREEAISLIKEITEEKCTNIVGHDIILIDPTPGDGFSEGYKLRIKTKLNQNSLRCLELIVKENDYSLKNEVANGTIVIYEPQNSSYGDMARM